MKEKIEFAHLHARVFMPGINKQIEKGINQETCQGIEMWRLDNGDVEWKYKGRHGFWHGTLFQGLVCPVEKPEPRVEPTAEVKVPEPRVKSKTKE